MRWVNRRRKEGVKEKNMDKRGARKKTNEKVDPVSPGRRHHTQRWEAKVRVVSGTRSLKKR